MGDIVEGEVSEGNEEASSFSTAKYSLNREFLDYLEHPEELGVIMGHLKST